MEWEWVTKVSVVKEGKFTLIDWEEIDEAEIFEGNENTLTMAQKKHSGVPVPVQGAKLSI